MPPNSAWGADELFAKIREIDEILPHLEVFCAQVSSELSGSHISAEMFRRLGGMWLFHLAHQVAATESTTNEVDQTNELTIPFDNWTHTLELIHSDKYRSQFQSMLHVPQVLQVARLKSSAMMRPVAPISRLRQHFEGILQTRRDLQERVLVVQPYLKCSSTRRIEAIIKTRKMLDWNDLDVKFASVAKINEAKRRELVLADGATNLRAVLQTLIPFVLPVAYGEAFSELRQHALRSSEQPRAMYSANASQFHLPFQILSAVWGAEGTRIVSHQHGGHQGLDEACAAENYEARTNDVHYTLGWTDQRSNVRSLPAAMPRKSRRVIKHRLLLMTVSHTDVIYRLQPFCMPSHTRLCAAETRAFLTQLTWPTKPVIRGSSRDINAMQIQTSIEHEDFVEQGTISASRSSLVIHNYMGVSWLETLAMNIPTVCFIPSGIHRFRATAQPFAESLQHIGILHYSGKEAAKFVNSLNGDPSSWWKSAEVQEAREAFVARYANFSDNWVEAWQTEFESLLAR